MTAAAEGSRSGRSHSDPGIPVVRRISTTPRQPGTPRQPRDRGQADPIVTGGTPPTKGNEKAFTSGSGCIGSGDEEAGVPRGYMPVSMLLSAAVLLLLILGVVGYGDCDWFCE